MMSFDPVEICAVLEAEGVDFVILGGFAAVIHGSPVPTEDIDIIPSRDGPNLERLARALKTLDIGNANHPRLHGIPAPGSGSTTHRQPLTDS